MHYRAAPTASYPAGRYLWRPNLKDEGDNFIMEIAVAAWPCTIVTHNLKDFVRAELRFPQFVQRQRQAREHDAPKWRLKPMKFTKLKGIPGALRDASPDAWGRRVPELTGVHIVLKTKHLPNGCGIKINGDL